MYLPSIKTSIISLLALFLIMSFACTPKKLSGNYGDNKTYQDEDSVKQVKSVEKKGKMPFDTSSNQFFDTK